ncbi:MAG: CPBP family intramembrane metalloprotease [Candidatus Lernaella stagnicola]|nr:CPBP family intramembrane metalloprotease [Candidatus Lernaella stagnicola]
MSGRGETSTFAIAGSAGVAVLAYLLVAVTAFRSLGGMPGDLFFVAVQLMSLPVAWWAMRALGATRIRSDLTPITESAALAGGLLLAMLALIGTRPAVGDTLTFFPAAVLAALVIAVAEESLFRGALIPLLARRFGFFPAVVFGAALFGAGHLQAGIGSGLAAFLVGLALGGLYLRSGLGACVVFHAAFNILAGPFFGLHVGGLPWPGLLEPALSHDPLSSLPVQLGALLLALWWAPFGVRRGDVRRRAA